MEPMKEWKHGQVDVKRQIQITCTVNNTYNSYYLLLYTSVTLLFIFVSCTSTRCSYLVLQVRTDHRCTRYIFNLQNLPL